MSEQQTEIVSFSGRRGTGKSTLLAWELKRKRQLVLFDSLGEHSWCPNPIYDMEKFEEFLEWSREKPKDLPPGEQKSFACRYVPQGDPVEEVEDFSHAVYRRGGAFVAFEEIPFFCNSPSSMPQEFGRLVRLSRHRNIHILWTAQRFAEVPRGLTALTDVFCIFGVTEPRDLDALSERTNPEIAVAVAGLDLHDGILYDARTRQAERITSQGEFLGPLSQRQSAGGGSEAPPSGAES